MSVITISRTFGSGGSEVAAAVARALGWELLDSAFVDRVAEILHATPAQVQAIEERVPTLAQRIAQALAFGSSEIVSATLRADVPLLPTEERLVDVSRRVIEEAMGHGPVVVVGRGAPATIGIRADALHVLCVTSLECAICRVMERERIGRESASHRVVETNRQRAQYVKRYYHREWLSPEHYDLCLNTGALGIDEAAAIVGREASRRFRHAAASSPTPGL